jgi:hypothetical protein
MTVENDKYLSGKVAWINPRRQKDNNRVFFDIFFNIVGCGIILKHAFLLSLGLSPHSLTAKTGEASTCYTKGRKTEFYVLSLSR